MLWTYLVPVLFPRLAWQSNPDNVLFEEFGKDILYFNRRFLADPVVIIVCRDDNLLGVDRY